MNSKQQQGPNESWEWFIDDGLGGTVRSVEPPLESRTYSPFGEPAQTSQTPFGFTGEMTDPNGLVYLRARYYDPVMGRFPNLDPLEGNPGDPMSLNRYLYTNNPINDTDPSGLCRSNDPDCQAAVRRLENRFGPAAHIYWLKREGQNPIGIYPTQTPVPTIAACPTPPASTATPFPTNTPGGPTTTPPPGSTPTSSGAQRLSPEQLVAWTKDDIDVIYDALALYAQARRLPMFNLPFVKRNFPTTQGGETFFGNYDLHPIGATAYVGLGGNWSTPAGLRDQQYRKWIVVHEMNHAFLYNNVGQANYIPLGKRARDTFVRPDPTKPVFPTKYAKDLWDGDRPEYLVDSMTALIWDISGQQSPTTQLHVYNTPLRNITSQDGTNITLDKWILQNVPGFVSNQGNPTATP